MTDWDEQVDVLVMGSGAAGLTGALRAADLGLSVLITEKCDVWGGSAAMSAGALWIPANRLMAEAGIADSEDDAVHYLKTVTGGEIDVDRLRAFVRDANRMLAWLDAGTDVAFTCLTEYPDYNTDVDGACAGGRSLEPVPFDGALLGQSFTTMRTPYPGTLVLGKFLMRIPEARQLLQPGIRPKLGLLTGFARYLGRTRSRRRHRRDPYLTMGQALAGRLRRSLQAHGVEVWTSSPLVALVKDDDGGVIGAEITRSGRALRIAARHGVLIASGGFERDLAMRQRYQRQPITADWTSGHEGNTGDGIRVGESAGAALDTDLMAEAWWTPSVLPPGAPASVLVIEKSLPHGIFVDGHGKRFVNEAANYNDVGRAMYAHDAEGRSVPAWMIFDATYRKRYIIGPVGPGQLMPDRKLPPAWRPGAGWLHRADTIGDLAKQIGLDPPTVQATIDRFNSMAAAGEDTDFGRGRTANDVYYSDPRATPNPSLGSLKTAPFYAVEIYPGDLGTKAGLVTDHRGRVLDATGGAIAGLFAAGNTASTVMGRSYPGAGGTLAPAMTGAFVAAETIAGERP